MTKKEKMHLCTDGDSLLGANAVACGARSPSKPELATFGETESIFKQINCRKCMASKEYREISKGYGLMHPFSEAAMKANATRKRWAQRRISVLIRINGILQEMIEMMNDPNAKASLADAKVNIDKAMSIEFPKKLIDEVRKNEPRL
jgi:hypothetical protein